MSIYLRAKSLIGIDFHTGLTLLLRIWTLIAGAAMVFVITITLSKNEQGYYFTFASILGLQILFELGLNQVIVQLISHEMAFVSFSDVNGFQGDDLRINRIKSIIALFRKWYRVAASIFFSVTLALGLWMFWLEGSIPLDQLVGPWFILVLTTSLSLLMSPLLAVIEGFDKVGQVARLRLIQSIGGYILTWGALYYGLGLWATVFIPLTAVTGSFYWLYRNKYLKELGKRTDSLSKHLVNWRKEIFPFQWKIAVSWISGYILFQLFTPIVFINLGAIAAGKLGLSITIFSSLQAVGISWINSKIPQLTRHISRGEKQEIAIDFTKGVIRSALFTTFMYGAVLITVYSLDKIGIEAVSRLADFGTLLCIAITNIANVLVYGAATYMRSHRTEPMLLASVFCAILTLGVVFFVSEYGLFLMMFMQTAITMLISLPWCAYLLRRFRLERL